MRAHGLEIRQQAYDLWRCGTKKSVIARQLRVDYDTLLGWIKHFSSSDNAGLYPRYENCGRRAAVDDPIRARAIALRQAHRDWGAEYIRLHLLREFADHPVVQANQIRRYLKAAGLMVERTKLPRAPGEWVHRPLHRVQVDAKEQLQTADGKPCCYLNFIDEYTGAELDAFVFPLRPHQSGTGGPSV